MEIEIRRETAATIVISLLLVVFGLIGYAASPLDDAGRPVLLLPDVRAVEQYRRSVSGWAEHWRALDTSMQEIVAGDASSDLLAVSRQAQRTFEQTVALAREVDAAESPASMLGLREQASASALAYVDAGVAIARWVSAPSAENHDAAQQTLAGAGQSLAALEQNEWIRSR